MMISKANTDAHNNMIILGNQKIKTHCTAFVLTQIYNNQLETVTRLWPVIIFTAELLPTDPENATDMLKLKHTNIKFIQS